MSKSQDSLSSVTIEGAELTFRNFSGKEGPYNQKGQRSFSIWLNEDDARTLAADGWNVKFAKPRSEEESPRPYLTISVKYSEKARPPRVVLIGSKGRTNLSEDDLDILDWARFENVDLIFRPYVWSVNGKTGVKAYLQSLYFTLEEDELEKKYSNVPINGQQGLISQPKAIDSLQEEPIELVSEVIDDDRPF